MKQSGQSLHEYAIAIALIGILGLGALKLLGGNVSSLLGQFGKPKTQNDVQQLYALIGANGGGAGPTGSHSTATVVLKINPATGMVEITSGTGGITNATSADGVIGAASLELAQLASIKMSNGQPLPSEIQQLLQKLSATGADMSSLYRRIQQKQAAFDTTNQVIQQQIAQGKYGGPPFYDSNYVSMTVNNANDYLSFAQTYQQLSQQLASLSQTDPAMAALQEQVSAYAGAISGLSYHNLAQPIFSEFHIDNVQKSDLLSSLGNAPLAIQYFAPLAMQTLFSSPASRDSTFQQNLLSIGQQMMVGTPISSASGLTLTVNDAAAPGITPSNSDASTTTSSPPAAAASNSG